MATNCLGETFSTCGWEIDSKFPKATPVTALNVNAIILGLSTCAILASGPAAFGNNNLFLPGDAFFPTELDKKDLEQLQTVKTGERTFEYSSLDGYDGAFCGYAGYSSAKIPAVDDLMAKRLASVYRLIQEREGSKAPQNPEDRKSIHAKSDGMRVMFYPPEFQFPRHTLGLRYNERWVAEAVKFGHEKQHLRLCCLISEPDAIEQEWRDADDVAPLKVKLPNVKPERQVQVEAPVVVQGPVQAIVIGRQTLKALFQPKDRDELTIYLVDGNGIRELEYRRGEWQSGEIETGARGAK